MNYNKNAREYTWSKPWKKKKKGNNFCQGPWNCLKYEKALNKEGLHVLLDMSKKTDEQIYCSQYGLYI